MQGIGNDFVVLDARERSFNDPQSLTRAVCDRRFGIGADGAIFVEQDPVADVRMRMLNPDGSEAEMCGNGLRCVARFVKDHSGTVTIATGDRITACEIQSDLKVRVDMGSLAIVDSALEVAGFKGTYVELGNPHFVVFVPDVHQIELEAIGPKLEHDKVFPNRCNIHFVQVDDRETLTQRTWERGAGITMACGSGACASAAASHFHSLTDNTVTVKLPGGNLVIEVKDDGRVWMSGPAKTAFRGIWPSN